MNVISLDFTTWLIIKIVSFHLFIFLFLYLFVKGDRLVMIKRITSDTICRLKVPVISYRFKNSYCIRYLYEKYNCYETKISRQRFTNVDSSCLLKTAFFSLHPSNHMNDHLRIESCLPKRKTKSFFNIFQKNLKLNLSYPPWIISPCITHNLS